MFKLIFLIRRPYTIECHKKHTKEFSSALQTKDNYTPNCRDGSLDSLLEDEEHVDTGYIEQGNRNKTSNFCSRDNRGP